MGADLSWVTLGFWSPGPWEWAVIIIVAIVLFGPRLPQFGRWLGQSLVEFKKGLHGMQEEIKAAGDEGAEVLSEEERKDDDSAGGGSACG